MPELKNKVFAITRSDRDAKEFLQLVKHEGGTAMALPAIEIVPNDPQVAEEFLDKLRTKKHHYCAFMSQQAVSVLFNLAHDKVAPALKSTTVIAVGPKTKQSLEERGIDVKIVLKKFSSVGLVDLMSEIDEPEGKKIIIPRSGDANEFVSEALTRLGMDVDEVSLYTVRTRMIEPIWKEFSDQLLKGNVDAIIFTSASNVNAFFEIMDRISKAKLQLDALTNVVSIGPFTTKALKDRGIECFEAEDHTVRGAFEIAKEIV